MSNVYKVLPQVYDRWQQTYGNDYSTLILPRVLSTIKTFRIPTSTMLDLACGTGTLALLMARRGWNVWGVDGSEGMIDEAKKKFLRCKLPVVLVHEDMRQFRLDTSVMLTTCLYDSLNHLLSRKALLDTFRAVHLHTQPSGYFVFDVNNQRCFKTLWRQTETIKHKDFTMILHNSYDSLVKCAQSEVTLFMKKGGMYERSSEYVRERYFTDEEIASLLRRAGFHVMQRETFNFTNNPDIGKIKTWWVAQKRAETDRVSRDS
ncbi:MAG: class I SAM-dependent methyltransferase [Ignavibacteriae bacterium]|nr:class I SAM-dependent methyltransferase [Ignavibacteriota bacterium]